MTNEKTIQDAILHGPAEKYLTSRLTLCEGVAKPEFGAPDAPRHRTTEGKPSAEKMKDRKRQRSDRLMAALINSIGRIFAQLIGAVAGVVLGIAIAGHLTGTQSGYQLNQSFPVVAAEPQRLSQAMEYLGQLPDASQMLAVTRDAAPEVFLQRSITARRIVIFKTDTGEFIIFFEPAELHP